MKTALVFGYYGKDNAGDDAMLQVIAQEFEKMGVRTLALSHDAEKTKKDYGIEAVGHDVDLVELDYDFFVLGGGTQIQDYRVKGFENLVDFFIKAKKPGVKTCLLGVGATKLKSGEGKALAKRLCGNTDLIVMRDEEGKKELEAAGVEKEIHICSDLTFALSEQISAAKKNAILFCPIPYYEIYELKPEDDGQLAEKIAKAIDLIAKETGAKISVLPFFKKYDTVFCEKILEQVQTKDVSLVPYEPLGLGLTKTFENFDIIVGMRFHSLVFSAFLGKPFVAMAFTAKTKNLVNDFSWEEFAVGQGFKAEELAGKVVKLFREQGEVGVKVEAKRIEFKAKALKAFELFKGKLLT